MKRLVVDLCCGVGGWARPLTDLGYEVVGFDVERHLLRGCVYPGRLVLQDVRLLEGIRFRGAVLIVASPPCQEFSRHEMPWTRAKAVEPDLSIVRACERVAREAGVPLVLENVRAAWRWLGPSVARYGACHLWGDGVPALMPYTGRSNGKRLVGGSDRNKRVERSIVPYGLGEWIGRAYLGCELRVP